ncbi:MAG: DUF4230 domain-containing protein [Lachnospiraceae bacterium]|nr:DUF4230 domain-containing protein [Lachnospiraceae bacterium]
MRKAIKLFFMCMLLLFMCSCANQGENRLPDEEGTETADESVNAVCPDLSQIRSICDLATLECYYHNVAKSVKEKGEGLTHIGEKERIFWIEYSGVAKFGVDISKVNMQTDGERVVITIPKAELLGLSKYSFTEDSYISSDDRMINKNPITAENQTEAIAVAEENIKQLFAEDDAMLARAQDNAKKLIENYIKQLGQISKVDYQIEWHYEENITDTSD